MALGVLTFVFDPFGGGPALPAAAVVAPLSSASTPQDPPPVTNSSFSNGTISVRRNWLTPIVFDPNNPATMYYGGNVLNKTTDRGTTWTRISPESVAVSERWVAAIRRPRNAATPQATTPTPRSGRPMVP